MLHCIITFQLAGNNNYCCCYYYWLVNLIETQGLLYKSEQLSFKEAKYILEIYIEREIIQQGLTSQKKTASFLSPLLVYTNYTMKSVQGDSARSNNNSVASVSILCFCCFVLKVAQFLRMLIMSITDRTQTYYLSIFKVYNNRNAEIQLLQTSNLLFPWFSWFLLM